MSGQAIIHKEDIIGGDTLVERQELAPFAKSADIKSAAYKEENYFAKAVDLPPVPQYILDVNKDQLVWTDDWITISSSVALSNRAIKTYKCYIQTGLGVIDITPIISHPRSETHSSTPPLEFYVKDSNGLITKTADFETIHLEYSISEPVSGLVNYDTRKSIGINVIQDEEAGESSHSSTMRSVFLACYPELWTQFGVQSFESIKQALCGYKSVSASFEPKAAELFRAGMLLRPYVSGATTEQVGSNPNFFKVGAHFGNWGQFPPNQQEQNITPADDVFLTNVAAVAARNDVEVANTEYVPNLPGLLGRYGWTSAGWTGDFESGFTHTPGNVLPLSRLCYIKVDKYWIDFVVTGRTAGSFTITLNSKTSEAYTATGRWVLTTTSLDGNTIVITPTSDFDGKINIKCNAVLNQTTFGRGLEFSEDMNEGEVMSTPLPDSFVAYAMVCTNEDGSIITATLDPSGRPYNPNWTEKFEVGELVEIRTTPVQTVEVAEVLGVNSIRIVTPITPIVNAPNNPYIWRFTTGRTLHSIIGYGQQQSPTCSIVGAKLLKIKLLTGANWQLVREAARITAKKTVGGVFGNYPGHWDKYRGFGYIYPDDAIQWIKDNYTENEDYQSAVSAEMDKVMGINPLLSFSSLGENTAIPKRMLPHVFSGMGSISEILDTDYIPVRREDGTIKMVSYSLLKTSLKTYFDTLYQLK